VFLLKLDKFLSNTKQELFNTGGEPYGFFSENSEPVKPKRSPATTPESRENQMISHAVDLAEKQLMEGTASAQVISHFFEAWFIARES